MSKPLPSLTGSTVAGWTVGRRADPSTYNCLCPAGHKFNQQSGALRRGNPAPCPKCVHNANPEAKAKRGEPLPPIGSKRGCWTIIEHKIVTNKRGNRKWTMVFQCSCPAAGTAQGGFPEWRGCETRKCGSCSRAGRKRQSKPKAPPRPKEPKPVKPMKLAAVKPNKPKAAVKVPMVEVPLPTEWNAKTILDLIVRRRGFR